MAKQVLISRARLQTPQTAAVVSKCAEKRIRIEVSSYSESELDDHIGHNKVGQSKATHPAYGLIALGSRHPSGAPSAPQLYREF